MNAQQKRALRHPCFHAGETVHPRFGVRLPPPDDDVSARLTLNVGLE